ncbi:MAG: hypothetical protein HKL86_04125 [Acidimicrobiaceae bacterium]|nr:hypothetical protein [Acidimicrobiaceae bacterium]
MEYRTARLVSSRLARVVTTMALLSGGASLLVSSPAGASGSAANTISAVAGPSDASVKGFFTPSAKATSGDAVTITLNSRSSGCTLKSDRVTFSAAGTCVVAYNDPGNATYAPAAQVTQSIKVYAANTISVSTSPAAGSTGGSYSPGAAATSGDTVVRSLMSTSSGCSLVSNRVVFTGAGVCRVDFNDAGNGAFAPAAQVTQSIKVYAANTIYPSVAPAAGTVNGTYSPRASSSAGDAVTISLGASSTGCSLLKSVVTFTGNGVCVVHFNDPGNGAFAAASEVRQSITVGTGNPRAQAALMLLSRRATHGHPLVLVSSGGSGSGAVTYTVTTVGTAGCSISRGILHTERAGSCWVMVTKSADALYSSEKSLATSITVAAQRPAAVRMSSVVWTGRTVMTSIIGSGFYGTPKVLSNARGTMVSVVRDSGNRLTIRVRVSKGIPTGLHRFTLFFSHGQRTSVKYRQR